MRQWLILLLLFGAVGLQASDLMRESRMAEQLKRNLAEGEWVQLQADGNDFIALQTDSPAVQRRGAVILLHDLGGHPDERDVTHELRTRLPASGWHLLSVQMPVGPANGQPGDYQGLVSESVPRIEAAVGHLKQSGFLNIVLVGHGLGGAMALNYMANKPAPEIRALAVIGVRVPPPDDVAQQRLLKQFAMIRTPLLDLYGSRDLPVVRTTAQARLAAGRKGGGSDFRQDEILGADHQFRGSSQLLANRIGKWMVRVVSGD